MPRKTGKELKSIRISLPPQLIKEAETAIRDPNRFIGLRSISGLCEKALNEILNQES